MPITRALVALVLSLAVTVPAAADGGIFWREWAAAGTSGAQRAVVLFEEGRETLVIETAVNSTEGGYAWVLPTPGVVQAAQVAEVDPQVFAVLEDLTAPTVYSTSRSGWPGLGCGCGGLAADNGAGGGQSNIVTVFETTRVGDYEVTTLSATESEALSTWLTDHGYGLPASAAPVLANYIARDWFFTAIRIADDAVAEAGDAGRALSLSPLALPFTAAAPVFPLLISGVSSAPEESQILLYVITEGGVESAPYPCVRLDTSTLYGADPADAYRARVRSQARGSGVSLVTEAVVPIALGDVGLDQFAQAAGPLYVTRLRTYMLPGEMTADITFTPVEPEEFWAWLGFRESAAAASAGPWPVLLAGPLSASLARGRPRRRAAVGIVAVILVALVLV